MNIHSILIIAIALIAGVLSARLIKKIKFPLVIGYIIMGIILGQSGFNIINEKIIHTFAPLNFIALGIIGFLIGSELKKEVFKRYGKSMIVILIFEGIAAFLLVFLAIGFFTKNWPLAILLGACASATAPAATASVLWEYKAAGTLTTMIFAIVALDDALALALYSFASSIARVLLSDKGFSILHTIGIPLYEIVGSALLGIIVAYIFRTILDLMKKNKLADGLLLSFTFGCILLIIALSSLLGLELILSEMFFGLTFVNIAQKYSKNVFKLIKEFYPPVYIMFFILVGAHLKIASIDKWLIFASLLYILAMGTGKMLGSFLGGKLTDSSEVIRKYLGMALFCQAGVTIGLAMMASQSFPSLAAAIIGIITLAIFITELIGPQFVKLAVFKADEAYRNITEEEMLEKYYIKKIMEKYPSIINLQDPLPKIFDKVSLSKYNVYLVADDNKALQGIISIYDIKSLININIGNSLFIAEDIMQPVKHIITPEKKLREASQVMKIYQIE